MGGIEYELNKVNSKVFIFDLLCTVIGCRKRGGGLGFVASNIYDVVFEDVDGILVDLMGCVDERLNECNFWIDGYGLFWGLGVDARVVGVVFKKAS